MRLDLLASDLEDLAALGVNPADAFARGLEALGSRPTYAQLQAEPGTDEGVEEVIHFYAEAAADMRSIRFSYATRAAEYESSRGRYNTTQETIIELQKRTVPRLRARLRELREAEASLELALRGGGVNPDEIGPKVPEGKAIDPTPGPGELDAPSLTLSPLPPPRGRLDRFRRRR